MDTFNLGPADPQAGPPAPSRSGRTKRIVTTVAASAVLLGGGAGIGVALTGGASASTGSGSASDRIERDGGSNSNHQRDGIRPVREDHCRPAGL